MDDYSCFVISNKPSLFSEIKKSIKPIKIEFFDGTNYPSFSKLVNSCVTNCSTEIVIMMSDKVRPKASDIEKILLLLNEGYAFVALYRLALFGFKKELFRRIGFFDERYVGGGYEDDDFYIRLKEANLGVYITEEVEYIKSQSSWNYSKSRIFFKDKWGIGDNPDNTATRHYEEEKYNYILGTSIECNFLSWNDSHIKPLRVKKYKDIDIKRNIKDE